MKLFRTIGLSLAGLLLVVSPVSAATTATLLPISDGNYTQWTPSTGSTHYTLVDESSCNGTTDFNSTNTVGNRDSYGISLTSIPNGATITQIDITPCASKNTNGGSNSTLDVFYRLNGVNSADAGAYSVSGTTPTALSTTSYSSLTTVKSVTTTLEIGAELAAGTKGARLGRIAAVITYTPLATPSALSAAASGSAINLSWTDNATNEDGFKVERSDNGGAYVQIGTAAQNATSYNDPGLADGSYTYRIRSYNTGGDSGYSNTSNAVVSAFGAPSNLSATPSGLDVSLSWTDNATIEDGFKIERADNGGSFVEIDTVGANVTTYDDEGLADGSYDYRVRAYDGANNTSYSNTDNAVVNGLVAPTSLSATPSGIDASLSWTDNALSETGYKIERADNGGAFVQIDTLGANVTTYTDEDLADGSYDYRVRAYNGGGDSSYSNTDNATIAGLTAPTSLTASSSASTIVLKWTDNASAEDGFKIERSDNGGAFAQIDTVGANVITYSDPGLSAGTYIYKVRAYNVAGNSAYTNEATSYVLVAPSSVVASASGTTVTIEWADNSSNEDGFKLERRTNGSGAFVEFKTVGANVTTTTDSRSTGSYEYRIRAYKGVNWSAYSNTATATVLTAPSALTATSATGSGKIVLNWSDNSSNEDGFKIERRDPGGSFFELTTVGPNITTYDDTAVTVGLTYSYRVRGYKDTSNSTYTAVATSSAR